MVATVAKNVKVFLYAKPIEITLGPNVDGQLVKVLVTPINIISIVALIILLFSAFLFFYCSPLCSRARRKRRRSRTITGYYDGPKKFTAIAEAHDETDVLFSSWTPRFTPSRFNKTTRGNEPNTFMISPPMPIDIKPPMPTLSPPRSRETSRFVPPRTLPTRASPTRTPVPVWEEEDELPQTKSVTSRKLCPPTTVSVSRAGSMTAPKLGENVTVAVDNGSGESVEARTSSDEEKLGSVRDSLESSCHGRSDENATQRLSGSIHGSLERACSHDEAMSVPSETRRLETEEPKDLESAPSPERSRLSRMPTFFMFQRPVSEQYRTGNRLGSRSGWA